MALCLPTWGCPRSAICLTPSRWPITMNENQIKAFEQHLQSELRALESREAISKECAAVVVLDQSGTATN